MKKTTIIVSLVIICVAGIMIFSISTAPKNTPLPCWAIGDFEQPQNINPVIRPDSSAYFYCPATDKKVNWECENVLNPAAVVHNDSIVLLYRGEDNSGDKSSRRTSRVGYSISDDGFSFKKNSEPVLYPDKDTQSEHEWMGGCEDPRVSLTKDGTYVMFYTQWNRHYSRLAVAHSTDLKHWVKYGPVFKNAYNGKYYNTSTKSASIVTRIENNQQVIEKVNGQYYIYWGDNHIYGAVSDDLIDWYPIEDENGELKKILSPREKHFDSSQMECGPPAIITDNGILFFYNGVNKAGEAGDKNYPAGMIAGGQALFDKTNPVKMIGRLNDPFFLPEAGDSLHKIYIQSLIYFNNKWYLYYGNDSMIAVATTTDNKKV